MFSRKSSFVTVVFFKCHPLSSAHRHLPFSYIFACILIVQGIWIQFERKFLFLIRIAIFNRKVSWTREYYSVICHCLPRGSTNIRKFSVLPKIESRISSRPVRCQLLALCCKILQLLYTFRSIRNQKQEPITLKNFTIVAKLLSLLNVAIVNNLDISLLPNMITIKIERKVLNRHVYIWT